MKKLPFVLILAITIFSFLIPSFVQGGSPSLYLAPSNGTFFVGSTFSVSIYVDTKENKINAVEIGLKFPADILQVTTPTAGESFVSEWLTPPSYSNIGGVISFKGGIPEGIATSAGLVSTITFRAKSPGVAKLEFLDSSKVLLADGKGTPLVATTFGGSYKILIPPPEGPEIFSPSHPDSEKWYSNPNPIFSWKKDKGVTDFSFSFSQNPQENPDIVSEGDLTSKVYKGISDGIWYFHLRTKKDGLWGRTSHFAVKIDTAPPQEFKPRIDIANKFVYFETKDIHSGINYYEISVWEINKVSAPASFFVEAVSPFKIPINKPGSYSVIVRAYDKAGNKQEAEVRFRLLNPLITYLEERGVAIKGIFFSWTLIFFIWFVLILTIIYLLFRLLNRQRGFKKGIKEIREAIEEIEKVEEKEKEIEELREKFKEEKEKLGEKLSSQNKYRL